MQIEIDPFTSQEHSKMITTQRTLRDDNNTKEAFLSDLEERTV